MGLFGKKNRHITNTLKEMDANKPIEAHIIPRPEPERIEEFRKYAEQTKGSIYKSYVTGTYKFLD